MKHTVFITGAAGYVGAMLVEQFAKRPDVERIIGLDMLPFPESLAGIDKLVYLCANTADANWQEEVASYAPSIIIHTAWHIREIYGDRATTWKWNVEGSENVFDFAFREESVERLVHFSTVASYGAFKDNTLTHRFTEDEPFRESEYLYAEEKRIAEERLKEKYEAAQGRNTKVQVSIIRPAAITGPRGRFVRIRFGLQAALSGSLKGQKSFFYDLISTLVSWVPVTPGWLRQFVHEDDIVRIVERLSFGEPVPGYEIFNAAPPGPAVLGPDMAKAVGKKMLPVYPWMMRIPFFIFWHLSRGKVPTAPGSWRSYSYPIGVSGEKVTKMLGHTYQHNSFDAFYYTNGAYEEFVPKEHLRHKST